LSGAGKLPRETARREHSSRDERSRRRLLDAPCARAISGVRRSVARALCEQRVLEAARVAALQVLVHALALGGARLAAAHAIEQLFGMEVDARHLGFTLHPAARVSWGRLRACVAALPWPGANGCARC
jgi:hypothetical protein